MRSDVILLPGLHGSTALFETFVALAPPWARCRAVALPTMGDQSFDALADALEPQLRALEGFVLFGESFSGPIAARLAARLGSKVALLVLCNPLVESSVAIAPSIAAPLLRSGLIPGWAVALAMTGGDRSVAAAILREVRALPKEVLMRRLSTVASANGADLLRYLAAPLLAITGTSDRLLAPSAISEVLDQVEFGVLAEIDAPHLVAQVAPAQVWAAISAEFQRAA